MNKKVSGVIFVLLASLMWALIPIIAKISFKKATFLQVALSEVLFSFIFISILILFKKENIRFKRAFQETLSILTF